MVKRDASENKIAATTHVLLLLRMSWFMMMMTFSSYSQVPPKRTPAADDPRLACPLPASIPTAPFLPFWFPFFKPTTFGGPLPFPEDATRTYDVSFPPKLAAQTTIPATAYDLCSQPDGISPNAPLLYPSTKDVCVPTPIRFQHSYVKDEMSDLGETPRDGRGGMHEKEKRSSIDTLRQRAELFRAQHKQMTNTEEGQHDSD